MKRYLLLAALAAPLCAAAQNGHLLEINNDEKISTEEFKRIYLKNNEQATDAFAREKVDDYMQLFINFKLKVYEAKQSGLADDKAFQAELKKYRDQLAEPYLVDQETSDLLYRQAYERTKKAVRASHILVNVGAQATPDDTLEAYNKALEIRERVLKEDFGDIAFRESDDPSAKANRGELGYFSAMRMVYPFETAAYETPVGEVSMPVRTQFGYHIIKVSDMLDINGPVDLQAIVARTATDDNGNDAGHAKILRASEMLAKGTPFGEVADRYSEDSRIKDLPRYECGRMFPEFDSVAFTLKENEVSQPFYSPYNRAWFIVRVARVHGVASYDESLDQIRRRIERMPQGALRSTRFADKLLAEYKVERDEQAYVHTLATLRAYDTLPLPDTLPQMLSGALLTFNDTFAVAAIDYVRYLQGNARRHNARLSEAAAKQWEDFARAAVIRYEDQLLPVKHPDFALTVKEYHDGILLFNITDSLVWQRASRDVEGLEGYFAAHRADYRWPERFRATVVEAPAAANRKAVDKLLKAACKAGAVDTLRPATVAQAAGVQPADVRVTHGLYEAGKNLAVDAAKGRKGVTLTRDDAAGYAWACVTERLPAADKELKEARGLVTADYQNEIEKRWIEELRAKYPVKINQEALDLIYAN